MQNLQPGYTRALCVCVCVCVHECQFLRERERERERERDEGELCTIILTFQVLGDHSKAVQLVRDAISKDQSNPLLYLQLLDLETSRFPPSESAVEAIFAEVQASEMNDVTKAMFAQRRVTFLEEFGCDINKWV